MKFPYFLSSQICSRETFTQTQPAWSQPSWLTSGSRGRTRHHCWSP